MLELSGISRTYTEGGPIRALRDVTLTIEQGEYVAVTGSSGSGKSTLLNVLGLLDQPSVGTYRVAGVETAALGDRIRVALRAQLFGFVFQAFHLLPGRSALENVELGMLYGPRSPSERRARSRAALSRMGLDKRAGSDPRRLSGGERQRVAVARAIAGGPRVLFCDEPTGNLDSANTENLLKLLAELHSEGLTIVIVTHDREVAEQARRQLVVRDGLVFET